MRMLFKYNSLDECINKLNDLIKDIKFEKIENPKEGFIQSVIVQFEKKILKLNISQDRLEAYGEVVYVNEITYNIKKIAENSYEIYEIEEVCKPFSKEGLTHEILSNGIRLGVITEGVEELLKNPSKETLIARGIPAINDEEDKIVTNFKNRSRNIEEESIKNIDYKNMYSIAMATEGNPIGELVIGEVGKNGIDLLGSVIKKRNKKKVDLVAGVGCKRVENKIVATINGRPSLSGQVFNVYSVYKITSDVDINTGNIQFNGDVFIDGTIKSGMTVDGNSITIGGAVEEATINSNGDLSIKGNILKSNINVGAIDVEKSKCIQLLLNYRSSIDDLINSVKQLKEYNGFMAKKSDGELVKILLEAKFKGIVRDEMQIAKYTVTKVISEKSILETIRNKFVGLAPLNIKFVNELYNLLDLIDNEVEKLKREENIKADAYFNYCQDSVINVSGDIIIEGKGQYISNIKALGKVVFISEKAVCRGGSIEAEEGIEANEVGTLSGSITNLKVAKEGIITANIVYQNTVFTIGERKYNFENNYKNVKAYIDKDGELQIDKMIL